MHLRPFLALFHPLLIPCFAPLLHFLRSCPGSHLHSHRGSIPHCLSPLLYSLLRFCLLSLVMFTATVPSASAEGRPVPPPPIRLWQGTPVRAHSVTLTPYLPSLGSVGGGMSAATATPIPPATLSPAPASPMPAPAPAIIVCPGGSYSWLDADGESHSVARWLQLQGIAAFVLRYRTQGIMPYILHTRLVSRGHRHPDPICDIQRAIQYLREHADSLNIDPTRLGAMGFSAGGHLVMSAAAYATTDFLAPLGISHSVSLRPDFVAPIYPVVTMRPPYVHKRSRRALLGEWRKRNRALRDSLSLELHVPDNCPPVFLLNCEDDPTVKWQNSALLDSALTAAHIPHLYTRYPTGGHGFGANNARQDSNTRQWQDLFLRWFHSLP